MTRPRVAAAVASRARGRVQGAALVPGTDLARQWTITDAILTAARDGDFGRRREAGSA